ncbi:MAG: hypothetical protein KA242_02615 [Chitinophagales bacterium]|jgi:hypothetical protein|nr:hypothetical protein [Chitinophagales bacterium]
MDQNIIEVFIPIIAIIGGVGIAILSIYAKNKERLAMIEKGLNPNEGKPQKGSTPPVVKALAYAGIGLGLLVGYFAKPYLGQPDSDGTIIIIGFALLFGALGYFAGLMMVKNDDKPAS